MDYPVCLGCLRCIYPPGCTLAVDSRSICTCVRPIRAQITFTTSNSASTPIDWVKQLQIMRDWKVACVVVSMVQERLCLLHSKKHSKTGS
jgi:hypothetical protein